MRKTYYYMSCAVLAAIVLVMLYGSVVRHGIGPLVLVVVVLAAGYGIIMGKDDE